MSRVATVLTLSLLACCCVSTAHAQFEDEYETPAQSNLWLRGLIDVRVARGGPQASWTDHGPGKLRFGGRSNSADNERETRGALALLAIQFGASLPWDIRAQAQLNVQPDVADDYEPWLIEAFLRREWGAPAAGEAVQAGLLTNPFSLEHTGPAWSPEYSLSASALTSWLWEEVTLAGVQGEWWHEAGAARLGIAVGAGYGPDQLGRLLALRGWAMGDSLSGLNSDLALPNGTRTDIFDERDHRAAAYTWITLADRNERGALKAGYFDNGGDQDVAGVWRTKFSTVGAIVHPLPRIDLIVQYLHGKALVRAPANDSSLQAFYGLLSTRFKAHRVTIRYDEFRINDLDGGNSTREDGRTITGAYAYEWALRHSIGFEYIWLRGERPRNARPDVSQDGWQFSYRYRY
jgi:hypothetical protein